MAPSLPSDMLVKSLGFRLPREQKAEGGPVVFRITSGVLDRHKDRMALDGIHVENYHRNPVLLWNHDRWEPAVGTAKVYRGPEGDWLMEPSFDGIGERSKEVAAKVDAGTLRTCSIGFRITKHSYNEEGGLDIEECELVEVSITNIPANPEAERVKNDNQKQAQKNDPPEPPPQDQVPAKALEQGDLEAIAALFDAKLAPIAEKLNTAEQLLMQVQAACAPKEEPMESAASEEAKQFKNLFIR